MSFISEFKEFAVKGNMIDMAVGIIIGGAFGKIISSLVNDVIMPPIGLLTGGVDFSQKFIPLTDAEHPTLQAAKDAGAATLNWGAFVQQCFDFFIIALCIFVVIKMINRLKKAEAEKPAAPPKPPAQEVLLTEIRDLLKARNG